MKMIKLTVNPFRFKHKIHVMANDNFFCSEVFTVDSVVM